MLSKIKYYMIVAIVALIAGYTLKQPEVKIETKTVTQFQERENVRTIIKERPDGTKETVIIAKRDTLVKQKRSQIETRAIPKKWLVGASVGSSLDALPKPTYTISLQYKVLPGLFAGLYGRTDGEIGLGLSYSF